MSRAAEHPLPYWPSLMDTPTAASYLALSETSFRGVAARNNVNPVELGVAVTRWSKLDLDGLIDSLPRRGFEAQVLGAQLTDAGQEALERIRRRQAGSK